MSSTSKVEYYEFLGVSRDCNDQELKTAYRRLAMQYHPDRNSAPDAEEKFKQASEAYQVLSDPQQRAAYDRYGHAGVSGVPRALKVLPTPMWEISSATFSGKCSTWAAAVAMGGSSAAVTFATISPSSSKRLSSA